MRFSARLVLTAATLAACTSDRVAGPELAAPSRDLTFYESNGCPVAFERVMIPESPYDENGDNLVCRLDVTPDDGVTRIYASMDNFIPSSTFGGCPTNFERQPYKINAEMDYDPRDNNRNVYLCTYTNNAGRLIIVDDNVREPDAK